MHQGTSKKTSKGKRRAACLYWQCCACPAIPGCHTFRYTYLKIVFTIQRPYLPPLLAAMQLGEGCQEGLGSTPSWWHCTGKRGNGYMEGKGSQEGVGSAPSGGNAKITERRVQFAVPLRAHPAEKPLYCQA